jgi:hypothetical protein
MLNTVGLPFDIEFFNWYAKEVEKDKDLSTGKKFLKMLKESPGELEKLIGDSLSDVATTAIIQLGKPLVVNLKEDPGRLINYLRQRFFPELTD